MTSTLSKYISRSPRYILQPEDNTLIRLAGPNQVPWEEGTEVVNMSTTGLAFTAPSDLCPVVGEVVKVQFDVPGATGMAAFALVIRVEPKNAKGEKSTSTMLVATQFVQMDTSQKLHIAQGLGKKLASKIKDANEILVSANPRKKMFYYVGIVFVLLLLWLGLFFLIYPIPA